MNRHELEELIEDLESDALTRKELHGVIKDLNSELEILNSTISSLEIQVKEKKAEKIEEKKKAIFEGLTDDYQILKDMIIAQRKELEEKDRDIANLEKFTETAVEKTKYDEETDRLTGEKVQLEKRVIQLGEEIELYRTNDQNARELITQITEENKNYKASEENSIRLLGELSEKAENYKQQALEIEKKKNELYTEFETEKEELIINKVDYAVRISELENQIEEQARIIENYKRVEEQQIDEKKIDFKAENEQLISENQEHITQINNLKDQLEELNQTTEIKPEEKPEKEFLVIERQEYLEKYEELKVQFEEFTQQSKNEKEKLEYDNEEFFETNERYKVKIKDLQKQIQKMKTSYKLKPVIPENISPSTEYTEDEIEEEIQEVTPIISHPKIIPEEEIEYESEKVPIEEEFEEIDERQVVIDGKRKCPSCHNQKKSLIHETIDRTNIIMAYPRMYGKKYRCGSCGKEWRIRLSKIEIL